MTDSPAQAPADVFDLEATKDKLAAAKVQGPTDSLHSGHSLRYAFCHVQAPALIAEVEALRKRVAELTGERDLAFAHDSQDYPTASAYEAVCKARAKWQGRAEAAEARVAELEPIVKDGVRRAENCMNWQSYAVEQAGALEKTIQLLDEGMGLKAYQLIKETAVATPEEVMERAKIQRALIKVSDAVIDSGRRLRSDPGSHELALANLCAVMGELARLDALKEGRVT